MIEIGSRVGRWTVIGEVRKNGRKYYECRCDCGTVKAVYYQSIVTGDSQSCGCLARELMKGRAEDLTGRRFGKLVVLSRDVRNGYWICECDCGNRKSIRGNSLTMKNGTRSCGCIQRGVAAGVGTRTVAKNTAARIATNVAYHTNFSVIESAKLPKNNTSGRKGVWWDKSREMWAAYIQVHGSRVHLGRYHKFEDAVKARIEAEEKYFDPLIKMKNGDDENDAVKRAVKRAVK